MELKRLYLYMMFAVIVIGLLFETWSERLVATLIYIIGMIHGGYFRRKKENGNQTKINRV